MCYIAAVPIAMMAISAAATAYSVKQSNDNNNAIAEAANESAGLDYARIDTGMEEDNDAAAAEKLQRELQTQRERARIRVAQGESGVAGNSAMRVLNSSLTQGSMDVSVIEANRKSRMGQHMADQLDVGAKHKGRVNSAKAGVTGGAMSALLIGGSAAEGYASGKSMTAGMSSSKRNQTRRK